MTGPGSTPDSVVKIDLAQVDHVLTTTPAVRRRLDLDRPVDRCVILECLEIATCAPNSRNNQDWRFVVVSDPAVRGRLAEVMSEPAPPPARREPRPVAEGVMKSSLHLRQHWAEVPILVLACMLGRPPEDCARRELSEFYGSILPAVWSFQLALRARGLGSTYTTSALGYEAQVAEILNIPDDVTQVALIPVAYFTGELGRPPRRPVREVTFWDGWGKPFDDESR